MDLARRSCTRPRFTKPTRAAGSITKTGSAASNSTLSASPALASPESDESRRPVINVALVVAGLGHVEYGFGAPERVIQLLSEEVASSGDDTATVLPYIIASKPLDSGVWLGSEHPMQATEPAVSPASEPEKQMLAPTTRDADAVRQWLNDPWGRKMADAVLLYDWIDDEPKRRSQYEHRRAKVAFGLDESASDSGVYNVY